MGKSEYHGYPIINSDEVNPTVQKLDSLGEIITVEELSVDLPLRYDIEGIDEGRTPIILAKLSHKKPDGSSGEFDGDYLVRVLDGSPIEILVGSDKVSKRD